MANANMVLLDSLAAQRADGASIVGRGVPGLLGAQRAGHQPGQLPHHGRPPPGADHPRARLIGHADPTGQAPAGPVLFQLPAFVGNIASASAGTVNQQTGTVTLAPAVRSVTVQLSNPAG